MSAHRYDASTAGGILEPDILDLSTGSDVQFHFLASQPPFVSFNFQDVFESSVTTLSIRRLLSNYANGSSTTVHVIWKEQRGRSLDRWRAHI